MGQDLTVQPPEIVRLADTVAAYSVVLGNYAPAEAIQGFAEVPELLEEGERIVALAYARVKKTGPALVVLTDSRLVIANARRVADNFAISPADWQVESAGQRFMWGNTARLRARQNVGQELVLRQFGPTSEATRILSAFGLAPAQGSCRALPDGFPRDPGSPPIAGLWELCIYHDRIIDHEGNHLPFHGDVEAVADAAGNIAVTRGRNLAAKGVGTLALGPIGLFFMGNTKERHTDMRELYLLVEGPNWAYTHAFQPELGERLRGFAQRINVAAREHRERDPSRISAVAGQGHRASLASELRELASLRDEGILTPEEFEVQKQKLRHAGAPRET